VGHTHVQLVGAVDQVCQKTRHVGN
jgi:hypothetical protein